MSNIAVMPSWCGQLSFSTTACIFRTTACISATRISCISSLHAFRHLLPAWFHGNYCSCMYLLPVCFLATASWLYAFMLLLRHHTFGALFYLVVNSTHLKTVRSSLWCCPNSIVALDCSTMLLKWRTWKWWNKLKKLLGCLTCRAAIDVGMLGRVPLVCAPCLPVLLLI